MPEAIVQLITRQLTAIEDLMKEERAKSSSSRERIYAKLEALEAEQEKQFKEVSVAQQQQGDRLAALERSMVIMSPTVQEFVDLKANAQIAGRLGKFLWKLGGLILAVAAGAAGMWASFWTYFNWR